ncbi:stAR-related lipid transfer protein 7, mitochondrial-like [Ananas comosus]|uniref:StAR-related lipid transfer protein 7, mitochondrial-like n=1 Tax=Ananas comosus TaxID=4615 RepID=A0A6P5EHI7_ANACO|nr:stAR-related lipid transfer protein 7, mitochondrial-like [Ananas comosus]
MAKPCLLLPWRSAGTNPSSSEFWRETPGGGWATAAAVIIVVLWRLLRELLLRRPRRSADLAGDPSLEEVTTPYPTSTSTTTTTNPSIRISEIIPDSDLRNLIASLDGRLEEKEKWEDVIYKKNDNVCYKAWCCRPKDGPPKYLSVTTFERCSTELLRDFYMDNEYRKEWDNTVVKCEQLQLDEASGTEIGRMIKKFPLLTPREYILGWRVWEGKDKSFYCLIKDCEHPMAPQQKNYVRVVFLRSGWHIRKVPGRDACEIAMIHQENNGMNIEMAKLAFAKGIWSYICKMNNALRQYSFHGDRCSPSVLTMRRLIQKVPPSFESDAQISQESPEASSDNSTIGHSTRDLLHYEVLRRPKKKWITNGLLVLGGIVCLSRSRSALGTQVAIACILNKLMNNRQGLSPETGHRGARVTRKRRL